MKRYFLTILVILTLLTGCTGIQGSSGTGVVLAQKRPTLTPTIIRRSTNTPTRSAATATRTPTRPAATATRTPTRPVATATRTSLPAATRTSPPATATTRPAATATRAPQTGAIVVDHRSIALFDRIPEQYLTAARNLRMVFMDQSVGENINSGLDCLSASAWGEAPAFCRRDYYQINGSEWLWKTYTGADLQAGTVPSVIQFQPDPNRYNRSNWTFLASGGTWEAYLQGFLQQHVPSMLNQKDVFSYQFTYLHVNQGSDIASPENGFFVDQPHNGYYPNRERWDISDLEEYEAQHPDKIFFYWTTSLARDIGTQESTQFNEQMRQYAQAHGKPLLDAADILSHDPNGNPCYDNRDAVQYCGANGCENNADDGQNILAICQAYTTETSGGHLGSVSGGRVQLAKAMWVLMAQIAGWRP